MQERRDTLAAPARDLYDTRRVYVCSLHGKRIPYCLRSPASFGHFRVFLSRKRPLSTTTKTIDNSLLFYSHYIVQRIACTLYLYLYYFPFSNKASQLSNTITVHKKVNNIFFLYYVICHLKLLKV